MTWNLPPGCTDADIDRAAPPGPSCRRCGASSEEDGVELAYCDGWICEECLGDENMQAEPCTSAARSAGCTCQMQSVNSASIVGISHNEPKRRSRPTNIDEWCPLHGSRDPDREYDARRDEEMKP